MIADPDCRSRSEHLRRAVVAVTGDATLVDHAEGAVREAQDHDRVVDIAGRLERRIRQRRPVGRDLLDLAHEPARRVEVVDRDVDEEAP